MSYDRELTPAPAEGLRQLAWPGESGTPCYLSATPGGLLERLADVAEDEQLLAAADLLKDVTAILDDPTADPEALRAALAGMAVALTGVLRIADSWGARLPHDDDAGSARHMSGGDGETLKLPAESFG
ncbi:hypothetical protein [Streptomyces boncukensis]|uniref:Uncharacterized protein n=1 Tax=Streptomyces boncukensis TaxID=2711219 RepID=A0A6G4WQB7_9ACTN|nr:hypothetical protein [Streptomyces boncukensis]NGO67456.1 hypothetical protein [Streptomyces boncukensis]